MLTEKQAFEEFDRDLQLDPDERRRAEDLHNEITALLRKAGIIESAFLQGSFARKTMLGPLRDIDKVLVLSVALAHLHDDPKGPEIAMDHIEAELRKAYPDATFRRTRHSLEIDFGALTFCFDAVPAFETTTEDDDVEIANRDRGTWDRSNTRTLIRVVAERNQACDGLFVRQVRMAKQFVKHTLDGALPGLHTESVVYSTITEKLEHAEACARIFAAGAKLLQGDYYEPTGTDMISRRLDREVRERARCAFVDAAERAREARRLAEAGDHVNAIRIWHQLFGNPFPEPPAQSVDSAFAASVGGSITSSGSVSRTRAGRQSAPPTRPWRRDTGPLRT